ncbi:hypothetical protein BH18VER1_BH18VER1_16800 [soil metagenome]
MKRSSCFLAITVAIGTFAFSPLASGSSRESQRLVAGLITKNQAQHLALKKHPGARIKKCELTGDGAHSIFTIELVKAGERDVTTVKVDGRSGKIVP